MSESPRVLSIQSHVVYGYVGNKSATFPLQLLGFEVDAINSVQFCNHTGYSKVAGQVLSEKDLDELVQGLAANGLDEAYTHLLTGYIGSTSFLNRIAKLVQHLKLINPNLIYVCDPVMGDNGNMYVPPELLPIYRETILPLADIISPNQFEIELLTKSKINSIDEAWKAIADLHGSGCKTVVLSSTELGDDKCLVGLASTIANGKRSKFTIDIPKLPGTFTGSGDLFASLFLAWMHRSDGSIKEALEKTVNTMQNVLQRTVAYAAAAGVSTKTMELQLIQSKSDIENPVIRIFGKAI